MTDRFNKFMAELSELTNRYGIEIGGCGCCGSPFVTGSDGRYYGDNLQYDPLTKKYKVKYCEPPLPDPPKENPQSDSGTPLDMGGLFGNLLKLMESKEPTPPDPYPWLRQRFMKSECRDNDD